ncbi:YopX family protein [Culicoidibacter larvae]|uniref:YopX protein domain-containing protein n=1 Tax=Culicoidibacter larvae TaxID=2579976 RepID=A0A5R8Q6L4_9FIRM|nr:YopX family protein [Culicoidibacter larvae]TLG70266.1 hypothetical protein FEZ08_12010 [Culicoidibacter larvae]
MREIKVRAYINDLGKVYDVDEIDFSGEAITIYIDEVYTRYNFRQVELLQYTGLKDKNGVEIYEGDIVQFDNLGVNLIGVIMFDDFYKQMYIKANDGLDYYVGGELITTREVIGNKFENPQLLKGEL